MMKSISMLMGAAGMLLVLGACTTSATPAYDARFGEAVRQAKALQTLNPEAAHSNDPVTGIDGQAGKTAIDRYQESFRAPPKTFEVIDIGGGLRE